MQHRSSAYKSKLVVICWFGKELEKARNAKKCSKSGWHRLASVYKHLAKYDNIDRKRKAPLIPTDDRCNSSPSPLNPHPT